MRTETFHTPEGVRLQVSVPAGRVDIETVDGEETRVELGSEPEVEQAAVIEARGGEVVVKIEERRLFFLQRAPEARVRITCPHGSWMALKCVSAHLTVRGKTGAVAVQNVSGNSDLDRVDNNLEAQSVSGNVTVKAVAGSAAVETVSGSIRVDQAGGSVTARSVSGNQRFGSLAGGTVALKSVSGDLLVGISRGTRLWMDVKSLSGETSSELEVGDAPLGGDGPMVELRANSVSGRIRITRA